MTIGTLMEIENCQIRGHVSPGSLHWTRSHRMEIPGLGRDWQENKRPPDQTLCCQKFGKICQKRRREEKSKSGLSQNLSSTMLDNCVVFTSLIQQLMSSKKLQTMQKKVGSSDASCNALQNPTQRVQEDLSRYVKLLDKIRMHR